MSAPKFSLRPQPYALAAQPTASSLSLRWRVMLLAMSMVAMVVVLMAVAVYAVVSRALYDDMDNQLHSRARLLIESGSLTTDPAKVIEGTAYSDVNSRMYPGSHSHSTTPSASSPARRSMRREAGDVDREVGARLEPMKWKPVGHFSPGGGSSPRRIARTISTYSRISRTGLPISRRTSPRRPGGARRRGRDMRPPLSSSIVAAVCAVPPGCARRSADAGAEADALGGARVGGQDDERVAPGDVGDPDGLVAERLGQLHPLDRLAQLTTDRDKAAEALRWKHNHVLRRLP